ncbi:hypothetical protein BS78_06G137200 [Paspalum vaginatum]|nr:hypothetical protein BS78_06G137200 [Paspalum vaginatum]
MAFSRQARRCDLRHEHGVRFDARKATRLFGDPTNLGRRGRRPTRRGQVYVLCCGLPDRPELSTRGIHAPGRSVASYSMPPLADRCACVFATSIAHAHAPHSPDTTMCVARTAYQPRPCEKAAPFGLS